MAVIDDFFEYLGILLLLINAILYIWSYRKSKNPVALRYFSLYLAITFIILFASLIITLNIGNNLFLSHFYFVSQFILLSLFYREEFNANQKKGLYLMSTIILIILGIQYITNPNLFFKFNILEIFLTTFPIIIYSIVHLYNSLSTKNRFMYINAGILMYLTTSTLIFILGDYITTYIRSVPTIRNDAIVNIWFLNKVLYVGYLLLILFEWKKNILPAKKK